MGAESGDVGAEQLPVEVVGYAIMGGALAFSSPAFLPR